MSLKLGFSLKIALDTYSSSVILVMLWAIANSPRSIFTLSVPRK